MLLPTVDVMNSLLLLISFAIADAGHSFTLQTSELKGDKKLPIGFRWDEKQGEEAGLRVISHADKSDDGIAMERPKTPVDTNVMVTDRRVNIPNNIPNNMRIQLEVIYDQLFNKAFRSNSESEIRKMVKLAQNKFDSWKHFGIRFQLDVTKIRAVQVNISTSGHRYCRNNFRCGLINNVRVVGSEDADAFILMSTHAIGEPMVHVRASSGVCKPSKRNRMAVVEWKDNSVKTALVLTRAIAYLLKIRNDFTISSLKDRFANGKTCHGVNGIMDNDSQGNNDVWSNCSANDFLRYYRRVVKREGSFCLANTQHTIPYIMRIRLEIIYDKQFDKKFKLQSYTEIRKMVKLAQKKFESWDHFGTTFLLDLRSIRLTHSDNIDKLQLINCLKGLPCTLTTTGTDVDASIFMSARKADQEREKELFFHGDICSSSKINKVAVVEWGDSSERTALALTRAIALMLNIHSDVIRKSRLKKPWMFVVKRGADGKACSGMNGIMDLTQENNDVWTKCSAKDFLAYYSKIVKSKGTFCLTSTALINNHRRN